MDKPCKSQRLPRRLSVESLEIRRLMTADLGQGWIPPGIPPAPEAGAEVFEQGGARANFQPAPIDPAQIEQFRISMQPLVESFRQDPSPQRQQATVAAIQDRLALEMDLADNFKQRNTLFEVYVEAERQMTEAIVQYYQDNPTAENRQWAHTALVELLASDMDLADNHRDRTLLYNATAERVNALYGTMVMELAEVGPPFVFGQPADADAPVDSPLSSDHVPFDFGQDLDDLLPCLLPDDVLNGICEPGTAPTDEPANVGCDGCDAEVPPPAESDRGETEQESNSDEQQPGDDVPAPENLPPCELPPVPPLPEWDEPPASHVEDGFAMPRAAGRRAILAIAR